MYQMDLNKPERIHFIGIGGTSMSSLAEILLDKRFSTSGSDFHETALTKHLETKGARVYYGQKAANTEREPGIGVVVYTAATHEDNPELKATRSQGPLMPSRAEFLGELIRSYKEAIAVSGIHGRTITASMLTGIFPIGDLDPIILVGGILKDTGGNIHMGGPDLSVTKACEYINNFLSFYPTTEAILNIEEDHLDLFKSIEDVRCSFCLFVERLPVRGFSVMNSGIEKVEEITGELRRRVVTFGKGLSSTYTARNIAYDGLARPPYDLAIQGETVTRIILSVTGEHNVYNSLAAITAALELGVGFDTIMSGLGKFTDMDRRLEEKGEVTGVTVINGYTHRPQEIKVTLAVARDHPHGELWYVFQPHIYTRTRAFPDQFTETLSAADEVVLVDIYAARKTDTPGVSSQNVAGQIEKLGTKAHYIPPFGEIETFILKNCVSGDLLITMGAGDIVKVGEKLLGR